MDLLRWGIAVIALTSTACASLPDASSPSVFVNEAGKIVVDQSPIRLGSQQRSRGDQVTVTWTLRDDRNLYFPVDGVQIRSLPTKERASVPFKDVTCNKTKHQPRPDFTIALVELNTEKKVQSFLREEAKCVPTNGGKSIQCRFSPPEGNYVLKYSVYICQGDKLFDVYDPYIMN